MKYFKLRFRLSFILPGFPILLACIFIGFYLPFSVPCSPEDGELVCKWGKAFFIFMGCLCLFGLGTTAMNYIVMSSGHCFIRIDDKYIYFPAIPYYFTRRLDLKKIKSVFVFRRGNTVQIGIKHGKRVLTIPNLYLDCDSDLMTILDVLERRKQSDIVKNEC